MKKYSAPLPYPDESVSSFCAVIVFWKAENCVLCVELPIRSFGLSLVSVGIAILFSRTQYSRLDPDIGLERFSPNSEINDEVMVFA